MRHISPSLFLFQCCQTEVCISHFNPEYYENYWWCRSMMLSSQVIMCLSLVRRTQLWRLVHHNNCSFKGNKCYVPMSNFWLFSKILRNKPLFFLLSKIFPFLWLLIWTDMELLVWRNLHQDSPAAFWLCHLSCYSWKKCNYCGY